MEIQQSPVTLEIETTTTIIFSMTQDNIIETFLLTRSQESRFAGENEFAGGKKETNIFDNAAIETYQEMRINSNTTLEYLGKNEVILSQERHIIHVFAMRIEQNEKQTMQVSHEHTEIKILARDIIDKVQRSIVELYKITEKTKIILERNISMIQKYLQRGYETHTIQTKILKEDELPNLLWSNPRP